jgi:hypothetical protein
MNVSVNPAIPGFAADFTRPYVVMRSRSFLILHTAILTLSSSSLMFSALIGTEKHFILVAGGSQSSASSRSSSA